MDEDVITVLLLSSHTLTEELVFPAIPIELFLDKGVGKEPLLLLEPVLSRSFFFVTEVGLLMLLLLLLVVLLLPRETSDGELCLAATIVERVAEFDLEGGPEGGLVLFLEVEAEWLPEEGVRFE
jgi:hypothetical protein